MATEVLLPQWSMGMAEGQIVEWYREVGDHVEEDDLIAAVEAEKTEAELYAPVSGTILRILVTPETGPVPVRALLAIIGEPGESVPAPTPVPSKPPASVAAAPVPSQRSASVAAAPVPSQRSASVAAAPVPSQPTASVAAQPASPVRPGGRQVTPAARRLAKELAVELASVEGTGPEGRITEDDVQRASSGLGASLSPEVITRTVPLTGMRGAIVKRMHASLQTWAQLTLVRQVDVTSLVAAQQSLKADAGFSVTDLLLRGVAITLMHHPGLNATLTGDEITLHSHVQLGLAVAIDDGLIVPVIRDADMKSLAELSRAARDLATKARAGELSPAEVSDSTFTVTNLGAAGIDAFTPIINPPEVAILGVGRVTEVFARVDQHGDWRSMMTLSLTIDHRAVDGAPGARFLMSLATTLSDVDVLTAPL